jgi:endonuclease/exonuclease/phosphatase family metal-dependent hydrolase
MVATRRLLTEMAGVWGSSPELCRINFAGNLTIHSGSPSNKPLRTIAAHTMWVPFLGAALSTIRRTAEASALRFLLTDAMKGTRTPVIVLGDINDGQNSNTANILTEQSRYLVGDSLRGGDVSLYTAQTLQEYRSSRDVYYTHIFQDMIKSLDHVLVSEEFYDNSRKRLWMFDGMTVNNDHLNFADHKQSGTNDHGLICAHFR